MFGKNFSFWALTFVPKVNSFIANFLMTSALFSKMD